MANAIKVTDTGGVHLSLEAEGGDVANRVSDTGARIALEYREKIFEPLWQVENGATRGTGGTGLGLAVSRRLARFLIGDVTVQSQVDGGSTFILRFPAPAFPERATATRRALEA